MSILKAFVGLTLSWLIVLELATYRAPALSATKSSKPFTEDGIAEKLDGIAEKLVDESAKAIAGKNYWEEKLDGMAEKLVDVLGSAQDNKEAQEVAWTYHWEERCTGQKGNKPLKDARNVDDDSEESADIYGFDVTVSQCKERCEKRVDCKYYSHGVWQKGLKFFGYRGKERCQLYSICDMVSTAGTAYDGTSVWEKPAALLLGIGDPAVLGHHNYFMISLAVALLTILNALVLLNAAADFCLGREGAFCVAALAAAVSAWLVSQAGFQNKMFLPLAAVHTLNSFGLLGVVLRDAMPASAAPA